MIYPFTVVKSSNPFGNVWEFTVKYQKVLRYEVNDDPANQYRNPVIDDIEGFFCVEADSEDAALEEVANRVANS